MSEVKPQGAQLKRYEIVDCDWDGWRESENPLGDFVHFIDVAPLAERIEKLEREKTAIFDSHRKLSADLVISKRERDTALRALAEARRKLDVAHNMLRTIHDAGYYRLTIDGLLVNHQPEKDANNG